MSITQLRGLQIRAASIGRDRIDTAFEASLASIESNIASIFNTMSTDAERMAAIEALTLAFQQADGTLQGTITTLINAAKAGAGLEADGSLVLGTTNFLGASSSLKAAVLALDSAFKTNVDALVAADAALQVNIDTLAAAGAATAAADLAAAVAAQVIVDAAQDAALAAEAARAVAAELDLQQQVTDGVNARTALNTTLSNTIATNATAASTATSAEATRAAAAETALQNNIDAEALARTTQDGVQAAALTQEVSDRAAAVTAEALRATTAEGLISGRVDVLEGAVSSGLTYDKYVNRATPAGAIDGVNAEFTLPDVPHAGSESLYYNGQLIESGAGNDYVLVGAVVTLNFVPQVGDRVKASYFR